MERVHPPGEPDWKRANGPAIAAALGRALTKPSGGWFVLGASRSIVRQRGKPQRHLVDGTELVSWTVGDRIAVAPAACPHLGAHLGDASITPAGDLVCPWHGLALPGRPGERVDGQGRWSPRPVHDDGILTWVQLDPSSDDALDAPIITKRPDRYFDAVIRRDITAEPADVLANRLDPWHGVHFHPYAFASLDVLEASDDALELRVAYRITPWNRIEVEARFDCPDPRTVAMTITGGEGIGSVVETHATPLMRAAPGVAPRTAVIEATLATSDRPGFATLLKGASLARPILAIVAARLWRDDARYAERTYALRARRWRPGQP